MACLTTSEDETLGFAASLGSDIFVWNLTSSPPPSPISPSFVAGVGYLGVHWVACQVNPQGTLLYLLDTRGVKLYSYDATTPTIRPVTIAEFSDEDVGALTALAIDWGSSMAYIGTRSSACIYTVNVSFADQFVSSYYASPMNSDIASLALSPDASILYYGAPAPAQGKPGSINAVWVDDGLIPYPSTPSLIVASVDIIYPDSILLVGSMLYFKDGGALQGEAEPYEDYAAYQTLFQFNLTVSNGNSSLIALWTNNNFNLPSGLVLSPDRRSLVFTSTSTLYSWALYNESLFSLSPSSSSSSSSSFSFSSSSSSSSSSYRHRSTNRHHSSSTFRSCLPILSILPPKPEEDTTSVEGVNDVLIIICALCMFGFVASCLVLVVRSVTEHRLEQKDRIEQDGEGEIEMETPEPPEVQRVVVVQ